MYTPALLPFSEKQAKKLSRAVRAKTISRIDGSTEDHGEFLSFEAGLGEDFPLVHASLKKTKIGDFGMVFEWEGRNPDLLPGLFLAHYDVVPAREDDPGWLHDPWSGTIDGNHIYGRGTLDMKSVLISVMEAAELLLSENFRPERTLVFAFGGDEEMGGRQGAARIAGWFGERNLRFEYVLDEGSLVAVGLVPGIDKPLALIGISEKGIVNIELSVKGSPGHSSMPPRHTSLGVLAKALVRIERFPSRARLTYSLHNFLNALSPHAKGFRRFAFAHPKLFWPVIRHALSEEKTTNALIRTTRAVTMAEGSFKENVLPDLARAAVNIRILPGETRETALEGLKRVINDPAVTMRTFPGWDGSDPVPDAPVDGYAYSLISSVVSKIFPEAVVVPFMVTVTTDSKEYRAFSRNILRFQPVVLANEDIATIHGVNERISFDNLNRSISFFYHVMREAPDGDGVHGSP